MGKTKAKPRMKDSKFWKVDKSKSVWLDIGKSSGKTGNSKFWTKDGKTGSVWKKPMKHRKRMRA